MAAKHANVSIAGGPTWVLLTNAADDLTAAARVQNTGGYALWVQATANTTAPTSGAGAISLLPGDILPSTSTFAQLFPGVTAPVHVWGRCDLNCSASISHA